jgi:hypothetical protein
MGNELAETLRAMLRPGASANPVLNHLIDAYAAYHLVLAAVGGVFAVLLLLLAVVCFVRFRAAGRGAPRFERRAVLSLGAVCGVAALLLGVIVAANLGVGLHPRPGFADSIPLLGTPAPGTSGSRLQHAFTAWLRSGNGPEPALVQEAVSRRLAWQRPKAIICAVLLVVLTWTSLRAWAALIGRSGTRRRALLGACIASAAACLLLVLMVMANTQAAVVPLAMTLFYG